jgi:hypothetical protein
MRISTTYLSIIGASLLQGTMLAEPDMDGPLVQADETGAPCINPIFSPEIIQQIHYLIKRSYRITERVGGAFNYDRGKIGRNRSNSFGIKLNPKDTRRYSGSFCKLSSGEIIPSSAKLASPSDEMVPVSNVSTSSSSEMDSGHKHENSRRYLENYCKLSSGEIVPLSGEHVSPLGEFHYSRWFLHEPFAGIHGAKSLSGTMGVLARSYCDIELDYPGFVAYLPREEERPPLIAVVFRGSQSNSFQPMGGVLGPSWLTNFCATKAKFPGGVKESEELEGLVFHEGYLRKYLSARTQILGHIESIFDKIPEEDHENTRIIFTGHSQGSGVALPAALDLTYVLRKKYFGEGFDNKGTPRFFVYTLSGPNSVGDAKTEGFMNDIIGPDNIVRHNSLFDIVTYVCPGEECDTALFKTIFGGIGVGTGYRPVGHLAIDDIERILKHGFKYNGKSLGDEKLKNILKALSAGYEKAVEKEHARDKFLGNIHSFYLTMLEFKSFLKAVRASDGLYFFVIINHYGSSTADISCSPKSATAVKTATKTGRESSFDPRLPETDLNPCLWRGQRCQTSAEFNKVFPSELLDFQTTPDCECISDHE